MTTRCTLRRVRLLGVCLGSYVPAACTGTVSCRAGSLIVPRHSCVQVGLGGGIITTTLLATTTSMDQHRVVATSIVALAATGLAASVQNFRKGNVQVRSAVALGLACAAGMAGTAAWIAPRVDESSMKLVFSGLLGLSALRMLVA